MHQLISTNESYQHFQTLHYCQVILKKIFKLNYFKAKILFFKKGYYLNFSKKFISHVLVKNSFLQQRQYDLFHMAQV